MVEDEDHRAKEEEVHNMSYDILDSSVTISNEIDDLVELAEAADNKYLDTQQVKFSLDIVKNTGYFGHDL